MLYNKKECEEFYEIAKRRLQQGESEDSAFAGKPRGFSKWLKKHHKTTGGIKLPKAPEVPAYECWSCGKVYTANKCPYCGAFKPRK